MKRKAQSALEYMMTYGWAILIIVIVAAVLYSLGIFSPSSSAGNTITGFAPFVGLAATCNSTGFYLKLGNNAGASVTFYNLSATTSTGVSAPSKGGQWTVSYDMNGTDTNSTGWMSPVCTKTAPCSQPVVNGGSDLIRAAGNCPTIGSRYSVSAEVWYSEVESLGTVYDFATGTAAGSAT